MRRRATANTTRAKPRPPPAGLSSPFAMERRHRGRRSTCLPAEICRRRSIRRSRAARFVWPRARPTRATSSCLPRAARSFILITTNTALPPAGTRIDPSYRTRLATIKSPNGASALSTAAGASYYRFVGVSFDANVGGAGEVIALGRDAQTTLAEVPHHLEFDRVLITGDAAVGQRRGIAVNAAHVTIANSDIRDIKDAGQDSQAIAGWNTPGRSRSGTTTSKRRARTSCSAARTSTSRMRSRATSSSRTTT